MGRRVAPGLKEPTSSSPGNPERLQQAALDVGARSTAAFDANDYDSLERFFEDLPTQIDHVMVTAGGPHVGPLLGMDSDQVRVAVSERMVLVLEVARKAAPMMRAGGPCCTSEAPASETRC